MPLNLLNVGKIKNNIPRKLKSEYTGLLFIGMASDKEELTYISSLLTKDWNYIPEAEARSGQISEMLTVSDTPELRAGVNSAVAIELRKPDGEFLRFKFKVENKPLPPLYIWKVIIEPNTEDRMALD